MSELLSQTEDFKPNLLRRRATLVCSTHVALSTRLLEAMTPAFAKQLNKLWSRVKRSRWQLSSNHVLLAPPRADSGHVKHAAACRQREHATAMPPLSSPLGTAGIGHRRHRYLDASSPPLPFCQRARTGLHRTPKPECRGAYAVGCCPPWPLLRGLARRAHCPCAIAQPLCDRTTLVRSHVAVDVAAVFKI